MQARYYDPVIGRFYSNDPVGFKNIHNFNRYAYANNNPYKFTDPDGQDVVLAVDPKGAQGNGHTSLYFQNGKGDWSVYDQGATGNGLGSAGFAEASVSIVPVNASDVPTDGLKITTNSKQDTKIAASAVKSQKAHNSGKVSYNIVSNNCTDAAVDVVNDSGAGVTVSNPATTVKPNSWIKEAKAVNTEVKEKNEN